MEKIYKYEVNQETVNMIQALHYEVATRKEIINFILSQPNISLNKDLFDQYHKELVEFTAKYDTAKNELQKACIPEALRKHQINWNLDFTDNELVVTQLCDCEVEFK